MTNIQILLLIGAVAFLIWRYNSESLSPLQKEFINKLQLSLANKDYTITINTFISVRHIEERVHSLETVLMIDGERILYKNPFFIHLNNRETRIAQSRTEKNIIHKHFLEVMKTEGEVCPDGYETIYTGL